MKKVRILLISLLLVLPLLGWVAVAHGQSFRTGNNVVVPAGKVLNETLFVSGSTLDIAGTVNGDVFCAGQNVTISGTVNGDVLCAGQTLTLSGTVNGSVRMAGQTLTLSGPISGNLTMLGQSITTHVGGNVAGDTSLAGQAANLNGNFGRDLAGAVQTMTVNGSVGRNVRATAEQLTLGSSANVTGTVDYTSDKALVRESGALVGGKITHSLVKHEPRGARAGAIVAMTFWMALYCLIALLLVALVLVLLMPRVFHVAGEEARHHLLKTFLIGLVASIVVPVLLVALLFTVVGIPLALFGMLAWLVVVLLSGPFAAYLLGRLVLQSATNNAIWTMLAGGAILIILYFVPFVGALTSLAALWFGLGTILLRASHMPRPQYRMAEAKK